MNLPTSIIIETFFGFLSLFIIAKVIGKTQISQLTVFDFISALIFGELVGNAIYDDEIGVIEIALAVFLWGSLLWLIELLTQKFKRTRSLFEGQPTIVIRKGKIDRDAMKKSKLDINQLLHLLRSKGAFSINEVEFAIVETDGSLSVLKNTFEQNPTRKDFNLLAEDVVLPMTIVSDGEIVWDNLQEIGLDQTWLEDELKKQDVQSYKDVFYAEYKQGEALLVQTM